MPSEESCWWYEIFGDIYSTSFKELELRKTETSWFGDFVRDLQRYSFFSWTDGAYVLAVAVILTALRALLTNHILKVSTLLCPSFDVFFSFAFVVFAVLFG